MNHLVCGSFGSQSEDDDIGRELLSPCSTMRRTLKKNRDRDSKNPYANRGLDKFYALLAQLEHKKQKIYTQKGSGNISLVRFVYSANSDDDWKPVVVKVKKTAAGRKNYQQNNTTNNSVNNSGPLLDKYPIDNSGSVIMSSAGGGSAGNIKEVVPTGNNNIRLSENNNNYYNNYWRRLRLNIRSPCVYLPLMIILVLLFLAIYGKAFAIVCTSVGWYLIPMIAATEDVGRRGSSFPVPPSKGTKKINHSVKKEYVRRFSEKSIVKDRDRDGSSSPKSVLDDKLSRGKHAHKKSW